MLPTPSPSPSPTPAIIETVRVATGAVEALHRLPVATSVLNAHALQNRASASGDAAMRVLPGFDRDRSNSAFTNYGQLRVSFSGAGNDRGLVLADGVPAQDGFGGQVDWTEYPAIDLTRAELLRGPGSALYGSGAIGGVLALQSFGPDATTANGNGYLSLAGGSRGFTQAYLRTAAPLARGLSASVAAWAQTEAYDDLAPGYQASTDRPAQSQQQMTSLRLRYAPSPALVVTYGYRGAWDVQHEGRQNYDFWRNLMQHALSVVRTSAHSTLSGTAYERNGFVTNRADAYPSAPGTLLYTQTVPTHESGVTGTWIVDAQASTLEVRADARFASGVSNQYNASNVLTSDGSGVQDALGLAVQETVRSRRGEAVFGLRGDSIDVPRGNLLSKGSTTQFPSRTDRALSPRAAFRFDLSKTLAFRVSAGGGFRAPYLNELLRGYVIGPISYQPNPNLVPERSSSLTGGFDFLSARDDISADVMQTFVNDAIDFRTVSPTVQVRSNLSHTQTDGVTAQWTHATGTCSRLSLSATQQYARITAGTPQEIGKQLPYVPKASASASFDTQIGRTQFSFSTSYLGTTYADDLNAQPLGTAVIASLHAEAPIGNSTAFFLNVDNVTNARYLSSVDRYGPPQLWALGIRTRMGAQRSFGC